MTEPTKPYWTQEATVTGVDTSNMGETFTGVDIGTPGGDMTATVTGKFVDGMFYLERIDLMEPETEPTPETEAEPTDKTHLAKFLAGMIVGVIAFGLLSVLMGW